MLCQSVYQELPRAVNEVKKKKKKKKLRLNFLSPTQRLSSFNMAILFHCRHDGVQSLWNTLCKLYWDHTCMCVCLERIPS
jgi:putative lipase involved disintegration of autophagic bodies